MLIQFKIGNFLSFKEPQTFSMVAGKFRNNSDRVYQDTGYKLLKFMSIYGSNASGKSNLVNALGFFQSLVVDGLRNGSYPMFCKIEEKFKEQSSFFEIKIKIDKKIFVYGLNVILSKSSIQDEYLYEELKNGNERFIFKRNTNLGYFNIGTFITSETLIERLNIYGEDIKFDDSILFLKLMNQNKENLYSSDNKLYIFKNIYTWIKYKLDVNFPESTITNYSLLKDGVNLKLIADKLNSFSTGIESLDIVNISSEKVASSLPKEVINEIQQKLMEQRNKSSSFNPAVLIRTNGRNIFIVELSNENTFEYKTMEFTHKNSNAVFSFEDESDGTVRLLDIIGVLLNQDEDRTYVIDEINRTFHPLLTKRFIEEFLELAKIRNTQLIVTTHESQLMDLKFLRRDEIGFIDKNEYGYSKIYSLDKYNDRFDKQILSDYFKGKYDAIPIFNTADNTIHSD